MPRDSEKKETDILKLLPPPKQPPKLTARRIGIHTSTAGGVENAVERAMVVGQEPELHEQDFIFKSASATTGEGKKLEEMERAHILRVVEECGGNQSHAAEILDIDRVTLYHKLKKYGWTRTPVETH